MARRPSLLVAIALAIVYPGSATAQRPTASTFRHHLGVEYGLGLFGASVSRTALSPQLTDYVFLVRGIVDPLAGFQTQVAVNFNQAGPLTFALHGSVSTLERNRFYGFGNNTEPLQPTAFYRLEQLLFESGATARISLGGADNVIEVGPFYRFWNTDGDLEPGHIKDDDDTVDDGGIIKTLRPYGVGRFQQVGVRAVARGGTAGLDTDVRAGLRFHLTSVASPATLDMIAPTLSVLGGVKAFVRLPLIASPVLLLHARGQRIFGSAPFQDAAYLGGRRTLKGFKKQQFAGDAALLWGWEVRATIAEIDIRDHRMTFGPLAEMDIGRVYLDGESPGSWHIGTGGGFWLRDHRSGKRASISLMRGDIGPRLYISLGSPLKP